MTNWTQNHVEIAAPLSDVKERILQASDGQRMFNMHKLFPDAYPEHDAARLSVDNAEDILNRTGSTALPVLDFDDTRTPDTTLHYETARSPNTPLLRELHKRTGWHIDCFYEDPCGDFEGTFLCKDGSFSHVERSFHPHCDVCGERRPQSAYRNWVDDCVCQDCERSDAAARR